MAKTVELPAVVGTEKGQKIMGNENSQRGPGVCTCTCSGCNQPGDPYASHCGRLSTGCGKQ